MLNGVIFQVITIANDPIQYEAMRLSFEQSGFTDDRAFFTLLDNSQDNRHDPYTTIRSLRKSGDEPYVILCHQDVRLNLGHGYKQLEKQVAQLTADHPNWVVAGNAGVDCGGALALHLDEPSGQHRLPNLPRQVYSLDENFLVVRAGMDIAVSAGLYGFHHYGTDLCLNAYIHKREAYVIDFLLTHLSAGNPESEAFHESGLRLAQAWRKQLLIGLIRPTTLRELRVSKVPLIERILHLDDVAHGLWRLKLPLVAIKPRKKPSEVKPQ